MSETKRGSHFRALRVLLIGLVLLPLGPIQGVCGQNSKAAPAGRVVWWGKDDFWKNYYSDHTNGLIECGDEFVTNAVAFEGNTCQVIRADDTVLAVGHDTFGAKDVPSGLSNAVSIVECCDNCVGGWHLALKKDGTVWGFRLDDPLCLIKQVRVHGQILSNVVALAQMEMTPLMLKRDGVVYSLGYQTPGKPPVEPKATKVDEETIQIDYGGESADLPYQYTTADPVMINGQVLSNVVAIAGAGGTQLALKKDGTVVGWGIYGDSRPPTGLSNVVAIAAASHEGLALKRDGTVVAWGGDYFHQLSVPVGLSNVIAIASAGDFNLAITTGSIPASVFIQPHGRLEEMEQKADLVFKGRVISNSPITNSPFPEWGKAHTTRLEVISLFKGSVATNQVEFLHLIHGPNAWSGGSPPPDFILQTNESYIIFAERAGTPDWLYSPPANYTAGPDVFRQLMKGDAPIHTRDNRPREGLAMKEAHWAELNLLLNDANPTNELYAIDKLDGLSLKGEPYEDWRRSGDFKRDRVLDALLPLIENKNEPVALRAVSCFEVTSNASVVLKPYSVALVTVANKGLSPARRLAAISALSGTDEEAVSNSLVQLLGNNDETVRASAVHLLPRFPAAFAEPALQERAKDASPKVRAAVADAIGDGKMANLLPTLKMLLADPDVHSSAGNALLKFDTRDVSEILKANLSDAGFRPEYLCKLAESDTAPWLTNLVEVLKVRREKKWAEALASGIKETTNYFTALMTLSGTYFQCWNIIHDYLDKTPDAAFKDGKLDWCLDALEDAGNTGSREPVMLYELYRTKGLDERATKLRQENGKYQGYDLTQYFDNADRQLKASASH